MQILDMVGRIFGIGLFVAYVVWRVWRWKHGGEQQPVAVVEEEKIEPWTVVPRIKHLNFLAAVEDLNALPAEVPYTRPLAGDLIVAYAVDLPVLFRMISTGEVTALGVTHERLHEVAVENLRRRVQLRVTHRPPVIVVETGGDLEACVLLLDELWPQIAAQVAGEVVVGVPTRSVLFATGSASPEGLAWLAWVREHVAELHGQERVHCLSRHLFVRRGARWEIFE